MLFGRNNVFEWFILNLPKSCLVGRQKFKYGTQMSTIILYLNCLISLHTHEKLKSVLQFCGKIVLISSRKVYFLNRQTFCNSQTTPLTLVSICYYAVVRNI